MSANPGYSYTYGTDSSGIITSKNSVKTKTIKTILPSDVILSREETQELLHLENSNHPLIHVVQNEFKIADTTNVGIQYFCIEQRKHLAALSANPHLSPDLLFLLAKTLVTIFTEIRTNDAFVADTAWVSATSRLLFNSATISNTKLYKTILDMFVENKMCTPKTLLEQHLNSLNKYAKNPETFGFFLFLIEYHGMIEAPTKKTYYNQAVAHREAILKSFRKDSEYRQYAKLPFQWTMGLFGYTEEI